MATNTTAAPATVDVPVTITVGDTELELGAVRIEHPARPAQVRAALANLLRTTAGVVQHNRDSWPRQALWVGDTVTMPGSVARATVVQVDRAARRYLVDSGRGALVPLPWAAVDRLASPSRLPVDVVVAAVLAHHGATGE